MTVTTTSVTSGPYAAAAQTTFAVDFSSISTSEIAVLLDGVIVDPADYTFTRDEDGTGEVVFDTPVTGSVLIRSNPAFTQQVAFSQYGAFYPNQFNKPLDDAARRDAYLKYLIDTFEGPVGKSAYELAVENGYVGTQIQWLASLQGPQGLQGPPGTNGTNGTNGLGVPAGGTTGQVLQKLSNTNNDTGWVTPSSGASISDVAYNATTWDGDTANAPSKNALRDKFVTVDADIAARMLSSGGTFTGNISVPVDVYGAGWNGSAQVPSKDALYDKIAAMDGVAATKLNRTPDISDQNNVTSYTPDLATQDGATIRGLTAGVTINNPTNAVQMKPFVIRIKDNGTSRTITWGSQYRAIGATLPAATVAGKTTYVGLLYNTTDTKFDAVSVVTEA